jgi:hypothetical protein
MTDGMAFDTNADFDQFLNGIQNAGFEYPGDNGDEPTPTEPDEPIEVDEPDPGPGPATPPPPVETFRIGDRDVPADEVRALYEMGKMFREGSIGTPTPAEQQGSGVEPPPPAVPPEPTPAPIPTFIDQDDPTQMGVWTELQKMQGDYNKEITQLRQNYDNLSRQQRVKELIDNGNIALSQFRAEHPTLTDDEVNAIIPMAQPIADAMVARYGNDIIGLKRAFYVAALEFDGTRSKVIGEPGQKTPAQQSAERKRKLGSLSSGSGSSPRSEQPRPQLGTDKQAKEEFAKALVDSYGANGRLS